MSCFRAGFSKALQASQIVSNTGNKFRDCFSMGKVCAIRALTGQDAPGIQRRPILSDSILLHIGKNITLMFDCGGAFTDKSYYLQRFGAVRRVGIPDIILNIQAQCQRRRDLLEQEKLAKIIANGTKNA